MSNQYTILKGDEKGDEKGDKEVNVLMAWFFYDWTQKEIARHYRISKKTVKRIIQKSYEDYEKLLETYKGSVKNDLPNL